MKGDHSRFRVSYTQDDLVEYSILYLAECVLVKTCYRDVNRRGGAVFWFKSSSSIVELPHGPRYR